MTKMTIGSKFYFHLRKVQNTFLEILTKLILRPNLMDKDKANWTPDEITKIF